MKNNCKNYIMNPYPLEKKKRKKNIIHIYLQYFDLICIDGIDGESSPHSDKNNELENREETKSDVESPSKHSK